jgi:polyhydroxybutyrate depolymerase
MGLAIPQKIAFGLLLGSAWLSCSKAKNAPAGTADVATETDTSTTNASDSSTSSDTTTAVESLPTRTRTNTSTTHSTTATATASKTATVTGTSTKSATSTQTATTTASSTATASNTDTSKSPSKSAGCGLAKQTTGDFHLSATDGNGTTRNYEVMVPSNYDPSVPLALTFFFHGADGTQATAKGAGIQSATGAASASIFAFPQGVNYLSYGVGWNDTCAGYDMVFFDHMVSAIESTYCVDTNRVFVGGFSWGCDFVTALVCCRGDRLRAVAAGSCSDEFADPTKYSTYANSPCPTTSAAGIRFTHDSSPNGDGAYTGTQFATTRRLYQSFNGCSTTSTATTPSPCVSYQNCAHPFVECAYDGLGHNLPASFGSDTWSFFSSFH